MLVEDSGPRAERLRKKLSAVAERVIFVGGYEAALEAVRREDFDVLVVDVFLKDYTGQERSKWEEEGVDLAEKVREERSDCAIVVYTSHLGKVGTDREEERAWFETAKKCADEVLRREDVAGKSTKELSDWLRRLCAGRIAEAYSGTPFERDTDLRTNACVEAIGEARFERMIRRLAGNGSLKVRCVGGGYSGAYLLRVEANAVAGGGSRKIIGVKVQNRGEELRAEQAKAPMAGEPMFRFGLGIVPPVLRFGGWHAATVHYADDGVTLEEILAKRESFDGREAIFQAVVQSCVIETLQNVGEVGDAAHEVVGPFRPSWGWTLSVVEAIGELKLWGLEGELVPEGRLDGIAGLVQGRRTSTRGFTRACTGVVRAHGDLHCRNILVHLGASGRNVSVIDFARGVLAPRFFDAASLFVDSGVAQWRCSYECGGRKGVVGRADVLDAIVRGKECGGREDGDPSLMFCVALMSALRADGLVRELGEFFEAVGWQLLRYLRFSRLGPMRRALVCEMLWRLTADEVL